MASHTVNKTRLLIVSYLPFRRDYPGGGWVDSFVSELSQSDLYTLGVIYPCDSQDRNYCENGISYYPLYARNTLIDKIKSSVFNIPRILHRRNEVDVVLRDFQPDVILLFGMETMTGGLVSHVDNIPVVVHLQGIMSEYVNVWIPNGINLSHSRKYYSWKDRILRYTAFDGYKQALQRAACEKHLFRKYGYYLGRTAWDKSVSRNYAPDSAYFHCDELLRNEFSGSKWEDRGGRLSIATIINGEIYKGYDNILLTASILSKRHIDFDWNVYGVDADTPMARFFEDELQMSFRESNVHFKGKVNAADLASALADTSIYVHPSHIDNSPNSVCEAMMVGVPCIAMNVGGLSSIIADGINGYLVDDYDCEGLADRIVSLSSDANVCRKISENARSRARERHSGANILAQFNEAISNIRSKNGK